MKCPERYIVIQQNIRKPAVNIDDIIQGEYQLLIETQKFSECYKEDCAAWDKIESRCRRFG